MLVTGVFSGRGRLRIFGFNQRPVMPEVHLVERSVFGTATLITPVKRMARLIRRRPLSLGQAILEEGIAAALTAEGAVFKELDSEEVFPGSLNLGAGEDRWMVPGENGVRTPSAWWSEHYR